MRTRHGCQSQEAGHVGFSPDLRVVSPARVTNEKPWRHRKETTLRLRAAAWTAGVAVIPAAIAANQWLAPDGLGAWVGLICLLSRR